MTTKLRPTSLLLAVSLAAATLASCGSDDKASPSPSAASSSAPAPTPSPTRMPSPRSGVPAVRTPELDAIGVIGHSGATGADSNGDGADVKANSWATGDNPQVDSVYQRLLATRPALKGHGDNEAISGSDVGSLMGQAQAVVDNDPVPDLVLIQSIDNDLQCDGSDEQNYAPFEQGLDDVLGYLFDTVPGVHVFFVDQWASVKAYDDVAEQDPGLVRYLSGSGPCDTFTLHGKRNPKAEAYLQKQVDAYFARIVDACSQYPDCATDGGAMQQLPLELADLTDDYNHLLVSGQAKEAAIVWETLPAAWTK